MAVSRPRTPARLRDPGAQSILVLVMLAVSGFVMLALAWRGAARTIYVPLQMPWVVSGGLAGLGLIGLAYGALSIHLARRQDAVNRADVEDLVRTAATLAEELRTGRRSLPGRDS